MSRPLATRSHGDDPPVVAEGPYNAAAAAPGYANVTGLVSTFALAAVVLVFLIAATASKTPSPSENADMGLATILFAVGFLGCLFGAFAFAALAGAPKSVALTNSMLIASVVAVCLIAVLGGFEALAKAFLHTAAPTFAFICAVAVWLSPIFVWFPLFNYERESQVAGSSKARSSDDRTAPEYEGWARKIIEWQRIAESLPEAVTPSERSIIALLFDMTTVAMIAGGVGLLIHFVQVFGHPHQWAYYIIGVWGLGYTGLVIIGALLSSTDPERRLTATQARLLNYTQVGLMFAILAVLP